MFRAIQSFVSVAEARSFVGASRRLGITPSAVSKQVSQLEHRLGVRLLRRTTRTLSLTEEGTLYHQRCAATLAELEAAGEEASAHDPNPRGLLRITAPTLLGQAFVAPDLAEFQRLYPEITIDLDLNDELVDLVAGSFDIAIRTSAQLPSSSLVAKKLAPHEFILCASPRYLERGAPRRPADLLQHECLLRRGTERGLVWTLHGPGGAKEVLVTGHFFSNSRMAIFHAAVAGCGIAALPKYLVARSLREKELVQVLPSYRLPDRFVYAVYTHRQPLAGRVRVFLDYIAARAVLRLGKA
jgi:DNA-binding transcriptional LysR family regulator